MLSISNLVMNTPGYDETVACPYNKSHVILKSRLQTHLVKCARNYPDIRLVLCPFNVTHRFRPEEKAVNQRYQFAQAHIETCPSRASFDQYRYTVVDRHAEQKPIEFELPPPTQSAENNDVESWDDVSECWILNFECSFCQFIHSNDTNQRETILNHFQVNVPTYNPQEYVRNAPVLRTLNLARPSERNKFRDEERHRLANLERPPQRKHWIQFLLNFYSERRFLINSIKKKKEFIEVLNRRQKQTK